MRIRKMILRVFITIASTIRALISPDTHEIVVTVGIINNGPKRVGIQITNSVGGCRRIVKELEAFTWEASISVFIVSICLGPSFFKERSPKRTVPAWLCKIGYLIILVKVHEGKVIVNCNYRRDTSNIYIESIDTRSSDVLDNKGVIESL